MSPRVVYLAVCADGFPRVSGDEPQISLDAWREGMFSPRERG